MDEDCVIDCMIESCPERRISCFRSMGRSYSFMGASGIDMRGATMLHAGYQCRVLATKFAGNVQRDQEAVAILQNAGWRVIVLWECGLRHALFERDLCWLPSEIRSGKGEFIEWPARIIMPEGE